MKVATSLKAGLTPEEIDYGTREELERKTKPA